MDSKNSFLTEWIGHQGLGQLLSGDGKLFEEMGITSGWAGAFERITDQS